MKRFPIYIIPVVVLCLFAAASYAQDEAEPLSKSYIIKHKTVEEFRPLVQAMLSNRGQVTVSESMNMLVVFDRPSYLAQVDSLFEQFDVPAQQFSVTIQLILGSDDPKAVQAPDSVLLHEQLDQFYSFSKYEELDKVLVRAEEKSETSFDLGAGQFNIMMDMDYIEGSGAPVRFRSLILSEYVRDISGKFLKPVYSTSADLRENVVEILTAIKLESMRKTLILLVSVSAI